MRRTVLMFMMGAMLLALVPAAVLAQEEPVPGTDKSIGGGDGTQYADPTFGCQYLEQYPNAEGGCEAAMEASQTAVESASADTEATVTGAGNEAPSAAQTDAEAAASADASGGVDSQAGATAGGLGVLPATGGLSLLGVALLLIGGGLLARRLVR
jgi:hypothetical protein